MHHLDGRTRLAQTGADLQKTPGIRGHDDLRAGFQNVLDFSPLETLRHFHFGQVVGAGAAAANVRFLQLDEILSRDGLYQLTRLPRELVKAIAGKNFVELQESDVCCGSAGTYNLTEMEMAERLQRRKIENILKTGAQIVVTSNPGCLLQIRAGLRKAGSPIEVVHIADFIDRAIAPLTK